MTLDGLRDRELHPLKILHHFTRLQKLAEGSEIAPVTVEIDPVAYCNATFAGAWRGWRAHIRARSRFSSATGSVTPSSAIRQRQRLSRAAVGIPVSSATCRSNTAAAAVSHPRCWRW